MARPTLLIALILGAASLVGCSTTSNTVPYDSSPKSTLAIQEAPRSDNKQVNFTVMNTAPDAVGSLFCRAMGEISITPGMTPQQFILEAFQEELLEAGAYSRSAPVSIAGTLETLEFSSVSGASWTIGVTLAASNGVQYRVDTKYGFKSSFDAISACRNVANAFTPAVQDIVYKAVTHPSFSDMFDPNLKGSAVPLASPRAQPISTPEQAAMEPKASSKSEGGSASGMQHWAQVDEIGEAMMCSSGKTLLSSSGGEELWLMSCGDGESMRVSCGSGTCIILQ